MAVFSDILSSLSQTSFIRAIFYASKITLPLKHPISKKVLKTVLAHVNPSVSTQLERGSVFRWVFVRYLSMVRSNLFHITVNLDGSYKCTSTRSNVDLRSCIYAHSKIPQYAKLGGVLQCVDEYQQSGRSKKFDLAVRIWARLYDLVQQNYNFISKCLDQFDRVESYCTERGLDVPELFKRGCYRMVDEKNVERQNSCVLETDESVFTYEVDPCILWQTSLIHSGALQALYDSVCVATGYIKHVHDTVLRSKAPDSLNDVYTIVKEAHSSFRAVHHVMPSDEHSLLVLGSRRHRQVKLSITRVEPNITSNSFVYDLHLFSLPTLRNLFHLGFFACLERGELLENMVSTLSDLESLSKYKMKSKVDGRILDCFEEAQDAANIVKGLTRVDLQSSKPTKPTFLPTFSQSTGIEIVLRMYSFLYKAPLFHDDFSFLHTLEGCNPASFQFPILGVIVERNLGTFHFCKTLNKVQLLSYSPVFLNFLYQEQAQALKVQCSFVNSVYAVLQDKQRIFHISDLCTGGTLQYHMGFGAFNFQRARYTLARIIVALEAYHKAGIVLQNLRPSNILYSQEGDLKVGDLSLYNRLNWYDMLHRGEVAKHSDESMADELVFIAPEVLIGKDISPSADFWSAGVIFYAMLTGTVPSTRSQTCALMFRSRLKDLHAQVNQDSIDPSFISVSENAFYEVNNTINGFKKFQMQQHSVGKIKEEECCMIPAMQVYTPLSCGLIGTDSPSTMQNMYERCYDPTFVYTGDLSKVLPNYESTTRRSCFSGTSTDDYVYKDVSFSVQNPFQDSYQQVTKQMAKDESFLVRLREDLQARDDRTAQWQFVQDYLSNQERREEIAQYNNDLVEEHGGHHPRRFSRISRTSHMSDLPSYVSYDGTPSISYTDNNAPRKMLQASLDNDYGLLGLLQDRKTDVLHSRGTYPSDTMSVVTAESTGVMPAETHDSTGLCSGTTLFFAQGGQFVDSSPFTLEDGEMDYTRSVNRKNLDRMVGDILQMMEDSVFSDNKLSMRDGNVIVEEEDDKKPPLLSHTTYSSQKAVEKRGRPIRQVGNRSVTGKLLWHPQNLLRAAAGSRIMQPNFDFYRCEQGSSRADSVFNASTSSLPQPRDWGLDDENRAQRYVSPRHLHFVVSETHQPSPLSLHELTGLIRFYFNDRRWSPFDIHERVLARSRAEHAILDIDVDFSVKSHCLCPVSVDFFLRLFDPNPRTRIGAKGVHEIKQHPLFGAIHGLEPINWSRIHHSTELPPFIPSHPTVGDFLATELLTEDPAKLLRTPYIFENKPAQHVLPAWFVNYPLRAKEAMRVLNFMDKKASLVNETNDSCCIS